MARGEIELHRRAGQPLPEGWAIDADGQPTTDPAAALAGAMLPFGGHKGSAIGTMIELLAGVMIGDLTSPEVLDILGATTLALDAIQQLKARAEGGDLKHGKGERRSADVMTAYIEKIVGDVKLARPLKIVMDCGNGVAGPVAA